MITPAKFAQIIRWIPLFYAGLILSPAMATPDHDAKSPPLQIKGKCPRTQVIGDLHDCLRCHVAPSFKLKESALDAHYDYPTSETKFIEWKDGVPVKGKFSLTEISSKDVEKFFAYMESHKVKHVVIEIHSPGGSLFEAWKIVGLMQAWEANGGIVETRTYGFAASAGFLIMVSGSRGHRYVSPQAELMWHELMLIQFGLKISSPSDTEEEGRVMRHLQDTANQWLHERSKMTKEQIDNAVRKREFWMNGRQAVEYGFADKLLLCERS